MTREGRVVSTVERQLNARGRYFVNNYAEGHTNNGVPDIISVDADGKLLAIECKATSNEPTFSQYEHGQRLLKSGCRFVIAYEDFDLDKIDSHDLETTPLPNELEELVCFEPIDRKHTKEYFLE